MNILISGATGEIGKRVLKRLCDSPTATEIHVLTRRPLGFQNTKLVTHQANLNDLSDLSLPNIDHCICCLGTTIRKAGNREAFYKVDHDYVINTALLAKAHNTSSMSVVSAIGANIHSSSAYLKTKGNMERDLTAVSFSSLSIFRPSLLTGNRGEFRLGEVAGGFAMRLIDPLLIGPLKRYRSIHLDTVADAIAFQALTPVKPSPKPLIADYIKIKEMSQQFKELF